jgi:hypothetical protein
VRITKPFYLGKHHVTVGQFKQFVDATGYKTDAETDGKPTQGYFDGKGLSAKEGYNWRQVGFAQTGDHPVVIVTFRDAQAFCAWLSRQEGRKYQLPTEAQWEYACRAGNPTESCFGDNPSAMHQYAWSGGNSGIKTHPVGKKLPNAFGLYDMQGNAQQWCSDWYDPQYYAHSPLDDPAGPSENKGLGRVTRGCSYAFHPRDLRFAKHVPCSPNDRTNDLGFRVALALPTANLALRLEDVIHRNKAVLQLLGPAAPFRIKEVRGGVDVSPREGKMPAVVNVTGADRQSRPYSFVIERADTAESVTASGVLFSSDWDIKFYSLDQPKPPESATEWQQVLGRRPFEERKTTQVDFDWDRRDSFALVATTELNVPSGRYEVSIVATHAYRVFIDGNKLLDEWVPGSWMVGIGRSFVDVSLSEGKHTIRLEYCKDLGKAQLHFNIQAANPVGP